MEREKKEKTYRSGLLSVNEQGNKWHLLKKSLKENFEQDGKRQEGGRKESASFPKKLESVTLSRTEPSAKAVADADQAKPPKSPKKGGFYLELKPFKKARTAREPESRPEVQRFRKPSDRLGREEAAAPEGFDETTLGERKFPSFHNTWEHTNFSVVPTEYVTAGKDHPGRERKRKKSGRTRKRNRSGQRSRDGETPKKKEAEVEVLYPVVSSFAKERRSHETGGQAVVIYQRHNRRDYLQPQTGDGYRFEQIAFSGNCEAAVGVVQSKRSLSEPRQQAPRDLCMAKRRTRFQIEPHRMASTQSDFHSALDFLKQSSASVEFNKFEGVDRSITRIIYQNPLSKAGRELVCGRDGKDERESTTTTTTTRLKQTAEKKLNLHREMMRAEKTSKKKFWESIERSLNYRCALAEMMSSQSFLSHNNSSKFFSTTESTTGRSTNIYVRESVIEKISSYQGFQRFVTSNQSGPRNKSENLTQTTGETYRKMKTLLDSLLIKEDEEEAEEEDLLLEPSLRNDLTFRSTSESTILNKGFLLSQSASDKLSLLETSLRTSNTKSDLELLMAKLSEEIRKCSLFIGELKGGFHGDGTSAKLSASDSKIELAKGGGSEPESLFSGWVQEQVVFPVSLQQSRERVQSLTGDWPGRNKTQIHFGMTEKRVRAIQESDSLSRLAARPPEKSGNLQREPSNTSLLSFGLSSALSCDTEDVKSAKSVKKTTGEMLCCDDCKRLKKKIQKLEKELERMERRMPFYPVEYQNSIRCCLESLKATSETVLKRLRSCAKLRYLESQQKRCRRERGPVKRPLSAPEAPPEAPVHKTANKQLSLRSSNSDCELNVGMAITMENVDPVTGRKLRPDTSRDCEQQGNIQCRMFKNNEAPVLVMDTNFSYNPKTGMLFKSKGNADYSKKSTDLIDDQICASAIGTPERSRHSISAYECFPVKKTVLPREDSPGKASVSRQEVRAVVESRSGCLSRNGEDNGPEKVVAVEEEKECAEEKDPGKKIGEPGKGEESDEEREKGRKSSPKNAAKSRESCGRLPKAEEEKEKRETVPGRSRSRSGESVKVCERAEVRETGAKSSRKNITKSGESLRKADESEEAPPEPRKPEEATSESRKLDEIAQELRKLTEIALESKKREECSPERKKGGKSAPPEPKETASGSRSRWKKTGKAVSRIPTRRKTTPSSPDPPSQKSSVLSLATTAGSSAAECYPSATSKILVKSISRLRNPVYRVFHKRIDDPNVYDKTTQTYGTAEQPSEECKPKTTNVAVQTRCPIRHNGVQTRAVGHSEGIQTTASGLSWEAEMRSLDLSDGSRSLEVFPVRGPPAPMTVNVALQVDRGNRDRPTASVALQTNLPTEESIKYKNDLQIQKKVNMAIAELCFHLSETKKRQGP